MSFFGAVDLGKDMSICSGLSLLRFSGFMGSFVCTESNRSRSSFNRVGRDLMIVNGRTRLEC